MAKRIRHSFRGLEVPDGPAGSENRVVVKDAIADIFLQQILTRPAEFDVIATTNLNGDYVSDTLAPGAMMFNYLGWSEAAERIIEHMGS